MTPDQQRRLDNITANGDDGKWFATWSVLFPDADPPPSPYADDLGEFMVGEVHRRLKPLCRVLLRSMVNDDLFEQYYDRLTRSSSSFLATFSGPLTGRGPIPSADGQPSSLNASLEDWAEDWVRDNIAEPLGTAARAFSPAPQTGSFTLPDDGSSFGASASQPVDPTRNIGIPQQTANHPEMTVSGPMQPDFTWDLTAIHFPMGDDNQFADSFPPVDPYQDANPHPPASSFDGFGFGQPNPHPDVGYPRAPQMYYHAPEVFQHGISLDGLYGPRTPQQQPTAALPAGFMNDYGSDNFTPQMTYSPATTSFMQAAAGRQSGGHAQEAVGDHVSGPQRRRRQQQQQEQHSRYERTGPRHL
ncbi:hypothetical protein LX32DRAFT_637863 [Colletotrichum zoysiae]|uniref:Uncharacterized protein n=1 Tax=Colletotrichum zoysiae TaxID=1216348 RepID=A0AAD9HKU7_9PEZI|nr:hypothetical protein LX32DRAFT_637863 [Colletotrichum zoysiae]